MPARHSQPRGPRRLGRASNPWTAAVAQALAARPRHGDAPRWAAALRQLPACAPGACDLTADRITIGGDAPRPRFQRRRMAEALYTLAPWRKGPFELQGLVIDSEWRSDWKWRRLAPHIAPLRGRRVLDVGCGNGYYALRMLGAGARSVLGVEPAERFVYQFNAITRFTGAVPIRILPLPFEALPDHPAGFDTAFSLGVLYHRRDPWAHLQRLRSQLRPGGELVLETLIAPETHAPYLQPPGRYAKMRNVWFLPTLTTLHEWLRATGFVRSRTVSVTITTPAEQRSTPWMPFESLPDFLDPIDSARTREGHPAPCRAIVTAERNTDPTPKNSVT